MRKQLFTLVLLLIAGIGFARGQGNYDFFSVSSGDTLYFKYTSSATCKVVPPSYYDDWFGFTQPSGNVTIPDHVSGRAVTEIGYNAFYGCTGITSVHVAPTVTTIGVSAFEGCTYLNSLYFDSSSNMVLSLDTICPNAFLGCNRLGTVFFYSTLEAWMNVGLGNAASSPTYSYSYPAGINLDGGIFGGNVPTHLIVPSSITKIKKYTFYKWRGIHSVTMNSTFSWTPVTSIGDSAFFGCAFIDSVQMGNAVTSIGAGAFQGCNNLVSLQMSSNVNSIGASAFRGCSSLGQLTIPSGVPSIGDNTFDGCTNLSTMSIPNSVTSIGNYAFNGCSNMTSVTLGNQVSTIGSNAFSGCGRLITITIPRSVTSIGNSAFSNCSFLRTVNFNADSCVTMATSNYYPVFAGCSRFNTLNFGSHVKTIPANSFMGCTGLTSVNIPDSVVSIGSNAFNGCSGLTSLSLGNAVTSIGGSAFSGCSGLTSLSLGNAVTSIGGSAFSGCSGLTSLSLGNAVTSIGSSAFSGCSGLTSVTIGRAVSTIGNQAFQNCTGLTTINFNADSCVSMSYFTGDYHAFEGCTNISTLNIGNNVKSIPRNAFRNCTGITTITIPDSVVTIGQDAFNGCSGLTSVTIGRAVSTIGNTAFQNCTGLTTVNYNADSCISMPSGSYSAFNGCTNISTVNIGSNVKRIPNGAFQNCTGISTLIIPDSVTTVGGSAFSGCTGLDTLIIGNAITSIGNNEFSGCTGLTTLTIGKGVTSIGTTFQNNTSLTTVNFNADSCMSMGSNTSNSAFNGCTNLSTLNIGNNVKGIPNYAFPNCTGLTSLTIPDSVIRIGISAFSGCSGLTSLTIGNAVQIITASAFLNCTSLTSVTIPNSVTSIVTSAFSGCSGMSSLTIGNAVSTIGDYAFQNCTGLTRVTIPNSVTSIGASAFSGCSGMSSLTIGNAVSTIGNSAFLNCTGLDTVIFNADSCISLANGSGNYRAFEGCTNISTVIIGNNVKRVPNYAFQYCTGLTSLTIGNAVKTIGPYAFGGCTGLDTVNFNADSCISMRDRAGVSTQYFRAFEGCTNISVINVGDNVKCIPECAFQGCSGLTTLSLGNALQTIGHYAFQNCSGLTSLTIGNAVSYIGNWAFSNCTDLDTVNFNADSCVFMGGGYSAFNGCSNISTVNIGNNVKSIPTCAFQNCTGISTLTIPDSVTFIGDNAFSGCSGISTLTIGKSVSSLRRAFNNCTGLTTVNFNAHNCTLMTYWSEGRARYTFSGCTNITTLNIGNNVSRIPSSAFDGCSNISSITVQCMTPPTIETDAFYNVSRTIPVYVPCNTASVYRASAWNTFTNIIEPTVCPNYDFWAVAPSGDTLYYSIQNANSVKVVYPYLSGWGSATRPTGALVIPATVTHEEMTYNVTSIGDSAFRSCSAMTGVTIPNSIDSIGRNAFLGCSGLSTVNFNADSCIFVVTRNGFQEESLRAFAGCLNITTVNFGNNVKTILGYAFAGCRGITTLNLPDSLITVGYEAFAGCWGLTSLTIPNTVVSLDDYAFAACTGITSLTLGESISTIGDRAFQYCNSLVTVNYNIDSCSIQIPMGFPPFYSCPNFSKLNIGGNVRHIPDGAFYQCDSIDTIMVFCDTPPTFNNNSISFMVSTKNNATVIVPCNAVGNYLNCPWAEFSNIQSLDTCPTSIRYDFWSVSPSGDTLYYIIQDNANVKTVSPFKPGAYWSNYTQPTDTLIIPSRVTHEGTTYTVKAIGEGSFYNCNDITSVVIPITIDSIGTYAFNLCNSINNVTLNCLIPPLLGRNALLSTIPVGVPCRTLPSYTAWGCSWRQFTNITEPTDCPYYDFWAVAPSGDTLYYTIFDYSTNRVKVVHPNPTANWDGKTQPSGALVIPSMVTHEGETYNVVRIEDSAFYNCTGITSVTIPDSIKWNGSGAFYGCTNLNTVNYDAGRCVSCSNTSGLFDGISSITTLNIGDSVEYIRLNTFNNCTGLTSVIIPDNVKRLEYHAFNNCTGITTLTIGKGVQSIENGVFDNCTGLETVNFNADNCNYYPGSVSGDPMFNGCPNITTLNIGNNVKNIPLYAFKQCQGLTTVTIPDSVTSIGGNAFYGCSNLTTVNFNADSCTNMGYNSYAYGSIYLVFGSCPNLSTLNIGSNVKTLPVSAFNGCSNLNTIVSNNNIPPSLGYRTFYNVPSSAQVIVPCHTDSLYRASTWGSWFTNITGDCPYYDFWAIAPSSDTLYYRIKNMNNVEVVHPQRAGWGNHGQPSELLIVPSTVEHEGVTYNVVGIDDDAFINCVGISSATIPNSIVEIGNNAFDGCTGLNTLYFNADSCLYAGNATDSSAFGNCSNLSTVIFGSNVKRIPSFAFSYCSSLDTVTIPDSVASIGLNAFCGCSSLTTVNFNADSCTNMGYNPDNGYIYMVFSSCPNFSTLNIAENVKALPSFGFMNCYGLQHVTIPNSVKSIGRTTFRNCTGLMSVEIGSGVEYMDEYIFYNCSALNTIISHSSVAPDANGNTFYDLSSNIDVYIPCGSRTSYESEWSYFTNFIDMYHATLASTTADTVMGTALVLTQPTCGVAAVMEAVPNYGYHFDHWSDGDTTNPRQLVVDNGDSVVMTAYFAPNMYTLNVVSSNSSWGEATGSGVYAYTTVATITAVPEYGYHFVAWSDNDTNATRTISVTHNETLVALFARNPYDVVLASDNNIAGGTAGDSTYLYLDTAILTAIPNYGYHFTMWNDSVTANPRTIVVTRDTLLTASFARNPYEVTTQCNTVRGAVTGAGVYLYEDTATVVATANYGYHFTMWSDGVTVNPRAIVVTRDTALTAMFDRNPYDVLATCNVAQGIVTGSNTYLYEDTATLTAIASYGYHFTMWSDGVTANPRTIVVTRDTSLTALFDRNQYVVTTGCNAVHGTLTGAGAYLYEDTATLLATANYGYHFTMWSDGVTVNPRTIVVTRDTSLTALFDRNPYDVLATCNTTQGIVTGGNIYLYEDTATLTAIASYGYHFTMWSDGVTANPRTIVVTRDTALTALFGRNSYVVVASCNTTQGNVAGSNTYLYEDTATLTAIANYGYHFTMWNDGVTANPRTIVVTRDTALTALFARNSYVVVASCNTTQGSVAGSSTYLYEDTATLTATANYGYHFAMWSDGVTANPRTIVVTRDTLLTALFDRNSYTVTAQCDMVQGGVAGAGIYQYEDTATLTATANYGYHFTMWSDGVTANPRSLVVTCDTLVTALFARNQYTLTLVCDETLGTVTGAGSYLYGDTATVTVAAYEGYVFNRWAETGSTEQTFDTVINGDVVLTALFDTLHYTLTLESNNPDWGSVTGSGEYAYGTEVEIAANANEGYRFVNWSDGSEENPRTIIVTEDVELTAVFAEEVSIETVENTTVRLYPNPTTDVLNIDAEEVQNVEVYDLGGRVVIRSERSTAIDFSAVPSGVYYVKVVCRQGTTVHKVVKK